MQRLLGLNYLKKKKKGQLCCLGLIMEIVPGQGSLWPHPATDTVDTDI